MKRVAQRWFPGDLGSLAAARHMVRASLCDACWDDSGGDVIIAVGEVLQNIVRHGFAKPSVDQAWFSIKIDLDSCRLCITIDDNAPPSDPALWRRGTRAPDTGGMGVRLIEQLAAQVRFYPLVAGNRAELWFRR